MKSYYYFVRTPHQFCEKDVVYKVAVGSSAREQMRFALVREWSKDAGVYFQRVSVTSDTAVLNLATQLFGQSKSAIALLRTKRVSITQLYKLIEDWSWDTIENEYSVSPALLHSLVNTKYFSIAQTATATAKNLCLTATRKYLSPDVDESPRFAAINFGLILAIFLLSCCID